MQELLLRQVKEVSQKYVLKHCRGETVYSLYYVPESAQSSIAGDSVPNTPWLQPHGAPFSSDSNQRRHAWGSALLCSSPQTLWRVSTESQESFPDSPSQEATPPEGQGSSPGPMPSLLNLLCPTKRFLFWWHAEEATDMEAREKGWKLGQLEDNWSKSCKIMHPGCICNAQKGQILKDSKWSTSLL